MGVTMMTGRRVALECRGGCHGGYHGTTRGVSGNLYGVPWDTVARHGMPRGCHGMAWMGGIIALPPRKPINVEPWPPAVT